jgi:hypothetical protein
MRPSGGDFDDREKHQTPTGQHFMGSGEGFVQIRDQILGVLNAHA